MSALLIAIVGAESTGKTTLAADLAARLAGDGRRRVAWVGETLRDWCDREGRTPAAGEQRSIMREQHDRIDAAASAHDIVVADTTALMTAVYSRHVFGDRSLEAEALALHATMSLTLLTAVDLPWIADGHQRTGEHVREPVDAMLRELLAARPWPWAVVGGIGAARLRQAIGAVMPLLQRAGVSPAGSPAPESAASGTGLFTGLADPRREPAWACACCSVPEFERALMRAGRR